MRPPVSPIVRERSGVALPVAIGVAGAGTTAGHGLEAPEVEAGAEPPALPAEHHDPDRAIALEALAGGDDGLEHGAVEGVELVGTVQSDVGDAVVHGDGDPVGHRRQHASGFPRAPDRGTIIARTSGGIRPADPATDLMRTNPPRPRPLAPRAGRGRRAHGGHAGTGGARRGGDAARPPRRTPGPMPPVSPDLPGLPRLAPALREVPVDSAELDAAAGALPRRRRRARRGPCPPPRRRSHDARRGAPRPGPSRRAWSRRRPGRPASPLGWRRSSGAIQELAVERFIAGGDEARINTALASENPVIAEIERKDLYSGLSMQVLLSERAAYMAQIEVAQQRAADVRAELDATRAEIAAAEAAREPAVDGGGGGRRRGVVEPGGLRGRPRPRHRGRRRVPAGRPRRLRPCRRGGRRRRTGLQRAVVGPGRHLPGGGSPRHLRRGVARGRRRHDRPDHRHPPRRHARHGGRGRLRRRQPRR